MTGVSMDIKHLEKELSDRLAASERQRIVDEKEFAGKKRAREEALAKAIATQKADAEAKITARLAAETKERERWIEWERKERDRREAEDQENLRLEAERVAEEERVRELQDQIVKLEFAEEQRRKALEQTLPQLVPQGDPIDGPDGQTPITSEMSDHLKRI